MTDSIEHAKRVLEEERKRKQGDIPIDCDCNCHNEHG